MDGRPIREVYPTFGPAHLLGPTYSYLETLACWCRPTLRTPCGQCDGSGAGGACWRCGGTGLLTLTAAEDDGLCPLIVVHNTETRDG